MSLRRWRREAFPNGPLLSTTKSFTDWFEKTTEENRNKIWSLIQRLAAEINQSVDGRPSIGNARKLRGLQSPVYYAKLTGDLRMLYFSVKGNDGKLAQLWILDVSDHDDLSRKGRSAEELVHQAGLNDLLEIIWDEESVVGEISLEGISEEERREWEETPGAYNPETNIAYVR